jgi:hypothetical protein
MSQSPAVAECLFPPSLTACPLALTAPSLSPTDDSADPAKALQALWRDFAPHRVARRYADYGWLNRSPSRRTA